MSLLVGFGEGWSRRHAFASEMTEDTSFGRLHCVYVYTFALSSSA